MAESKSKRINYVIYIVTVTALILIAFDTYLTIFIHNKLATAVSKPGRWPVGAYTYDPVIGFDFAPDIAGPIDDGRFYVKSHHLGYRISESEVPNGYQPGGVLSLGCSFTYGDEVESEQTFTQVLADSLGIPAFNYGICSFSYIHALLKAQELKDQGILDELKPKYVILGCWSGLLDRSRSPFPPLSSRNLALPAAYIKKDKNGVGIQSPIKVGGIFSLIDSYRKEGTELTMKRFIKIFFSAPRYVYIYLKNNSMAKKIRNRTFRNDVSDFEVYDFYFSGIEDVFKDYHSKIIVLFMPNRQNESPDSALKKAIARHPGIMLVDGMQAINHYQVPVQDYQGKHPQVLTHMAYAREMLHSINNE